MNAKPCLALSLIVYLTAVCGQPPSGQLPLEQVLLPPGFQINLYASQPIPGARQLAVSEQASKDFPDAVIVYVGSNQQDWYTSPALMEARNGQGRVSKLMLACFQADGLISPQSTFLLHLYAPAGTS